MVILSETFIDTQILDKTKSNKKISYALIFIQIIYQRTKMQFIENLQHCFLPELICLIGHVVCAIALIGYIFYYRDKTPIIQNSPILTISAQIALLLSSICLFVSKLIFQRIKNLEGNESCFGVQKNKELIWLNVIYTFTTEVLYMSYLLKMLRVILICYNSKFLPRIFDKELLLVLLAVTWGFVIFLLDYFMKNKLQLLYPQFNQFWCDSVKYPSNSQNFEPVFYTKLGVYLILFLITFILSFKLQKIDKQLKLRKQYFYILVLPYSVWLVDKILKIINIDFNTAMPVHYTDCLSNLIAGMLIFYTHFDSVQGKQFFLPEESDLSGQTLELTFIFTPKRTNEVKQVLRKYLIVQNKEKLFIQKCNLVDENHYNHHQPSEEQTKKLIQALSQQNKIKVNKNKSIDKKFQKAKQLIDQQIQDLIMSWKKTVSGIIVMQKLKKNSEYFRRMKQLGLVYLD